MQISSAIRAHLLLVCARKLWKVADESSFFFLATSRFNLLIIPSGIATTRFFELLISASFFSANNYFCISFSERKKRTDSIICCHPVSCYLSWTFHWKCERIILRRSFCSVNRKRLNKRDALAKVQQKKISPAISGAKSLIPSLFLPGFSLLFLVPTCRIAPKGANNK